MIGLTGAIPTPALLSVGIALVLAVVGGAWHIGLRLGRLSEKVDHIDDCIHRIEKTTVSDSAALHTALEVLDRHAASGLGELRDRIVRLETVGELRR